MEKGRKIIGVLLTILTIFCLSACGSIGTDTGNPEQPEDQPEGADLGGDAYSNYGVELYYPILRWSYEETDTAESSDFEYIDMPESDGDIAYIRFTNGLDTDESVVDIFVITLDENPSSLAAYLATNRPSVTFEEYTNSYLSGYIYDRSEAGANGGDVREIYFLQGATLLYIATELFETGSGSTDAENILSTINFTE